MASTSKRLFPIKLRAIGNSWTLIWKILIILVVFGFSALVGLTIGRPNSQIGLIAVGLPLGVLCVFFILKYLDLAPLIILFVAGFIPFGVSTGTGSKVMASLIVSCVYIGAWVLRMVGVEKKISITSSPVNRPLLGFVVVTVIATLWSNVFRDPDVRLTRTFPFVQAASALVMVVLPLSLLLVGNQVRSEKVLRWMIGLMLGIGALDIANRFLNLHLPVNAGGITPMWYAGLAVSLALFDQTLSRPKKITLFLLALFNVYLGFILHLDWLAGWLPTFIALGVICLLKSRKLFVVLAVIVAIFYFLNTTKIATDFQAEATGSGDTRLAAWVNNWRVTGQHFLFGTGPAGYAAYYMTYFPGDAMATHSNYIDIISQTGVVGLTLYMWLFGSLAWLGYRMQKRLRGRKDFISALAVTSFAGTIGCIVIMGFGDWLIPFAYTQTIAGFNYEVYSWIFMGTLVAMDGMVMNNSLSIRKGDIV
ncbi:MAG TPA: O-antigen ligase family protein [Anaerolineaceae bacterium]|nr:O-antigen ligase family protein [Anaerolineaceae bacterium]